MLSIVALFIFYKGCSLVSWRNRSHPHFRSSVFSCHCFLVERACCTITLRRRRLVQFSQDSHRTLNIPNINRALASSYFLFPFWVIRKYYHTGCLQFRRGLSIPSSLYIFIGSVFRANLIQHHKFRV